MTTDDRLNVLVIGSGGREHALAWKLAQSPRLGKLWAAPGNPGIASVADLVPIAVGDASATITFCRDNKLDLVVVGPEAPLVAGLADRLAEAGVTVFGPSAAAAQLEGSKGFTKDLCAEVGIPTAAYARFRDAASARAYVEMSGAPLVVKADGLAAGKGVVIAETTAAALEAVDACFEGAFGAAGAEVVVEAFLTGEEASLFALSDGETVVPFGTAQDHKRVHDGDLGPNTGGMGAYSPAPVLTPALTEQAMAEIVRPTVAALAARGTPFRGVLYAGLMITEKGPELIEYNVRFGDPECQVLMPRLESDLLDLLLRCATGRLAGAAPQWRDGTALTVVMAAEGYPGEPRKGTRIRGLAEAEATGATVFHAGTALAGDGTLVANGGRVLAVTAGGATAAEAQRRAYEAVDRIDWPEGFCRRDIGWRAVARETEIG
jgi:phosphoribosylamine--glycine ligase